MNKKIFYYKGIIRNQNKDLKDAKHIIEVPCGHTEIINILEVEISSKSNEIKNMKSMIN